MLHRSRHCRAHAKRCWRLSPWLFETLALVVVKLFVCHILWWKLCKKVHGFEVNIICQMFEHWLVEQMACCWGWGEENYPSWPSTSINRRAVTVQFYAFRSVEKRRWTSYPNFWEKGLPPALRARMFRDESLAFLLETTNLGNIVTLINQTPTRIRKWSICCQVRWVAADSPNKVAVILWFSLLAKGRNGQSVEWVSEIRLWQKSIWLKS